MRALRIALAVAALGAGTAQAGMFDDEEARRQVKDLNIKSEARFDQQGKAQLDLANQMQRQSEEIARLRGRGLATGLPQLLLRDGTAHIVWTDVGDDGASTRLHGLRYRPAD